jgi:hypothetical protein
LHSIPPGLTDEFQPLDRAVFGVLKAQAKRLFHARFHANPYGRRTKREAVADMITTWSLLGKSVIENAWDIYIQSIIDFSFMSCCALIIVAPFPIDRTDSE